MNLLDRDLLGPKSERFETTLKSSDVKFSGDKNIWKISLTSTRLISNFKKIKSSSFRDSDLRI